MCWTSNHQNTYRNCPRAHFPFSKPGHFIAKCLIYSDSDRDNNKKGRKKEKKKYYKKKGGEAHVCREWDSDMSSTDTSSDEDATNIAVNKGLLFPNVGHKCFMAKDGKKKKVQTRTTTSTLHLVMRVLLVKMKMKMTCSVFLQTLNELIGAIHRCCS
jgi:hypothetical protein